jgi:cyclopropane fatty-acyl-phospholipid synthase-like methyltransferase
VRFAENSLPKSRTIRVQTGEIDLTVADEGDMTSMDVDFGTYHHTTAEESKRIRVDAEKAFSKLLRPLYPFRAALKILDAGCGLGFLMSVAAKCFPKASITGVDVFRRGSMSELSMEKALTNMESLGIGSRTSFLKHDVTKPLKADDQYDLAVSNLVFHNLGRKRFVAYENVFDALKPAGYFVIGDLFPRGRADMDYFLKRSTLLEELDQGGSGRWRYRIKVLRNPELA